jgi:predicted CXXCH cytochrome family protein
MKSHVLRPLYVAIALVVAVFTARAFMVPEDFGVHGDSFTYNFYRLSNVQEWKDFPAKYQGRERCARCHDEKAAENAASKHASIQCENCHGPGAGHPKKVKKLAIDGSRDLCLRCHQSLPYPSSQRAALPAIDGQTHKKKFECRKCHDPHSPDLGDA